MRDYDVIVAGAGNAALAAAFAAREAGAERVLVLEKAPEPERGGNTYFSGGLLRNAYGDPSRLAALVPDAEERVPGFDAGIESYDEQAFWDDLLRVTGGRTDRDLARILIESSYDVVCWLRRAAGVAMEPALSLGGIRVGDAVKWPRGAVVRAQGEGVGLSGRWFEAVREAGVEVRYATAARRLALDGRGRCVGLEVSTGEDIERLEARAVVLGCGGFEANVEWRARYLGPPWDHAKVRGTAHNQGDGLRMALEAGALPWGQWSGCHSTPIGAEWPDFADRARTDRSNRLSYPFGVMINRRGERFMDEGEDVQFFTYAKTGVRILEQPAGLAWQIFDQRTAHLLEPRYATSEPVRADSLAELVARLDLADRATALRTLDAYNEAAGDPAGFDPAGKDRVATRGLSPAKSNWALPLDRPPFLAYAVTGGITFSFGGLRVAPGAGVVGTDWRPVRGLYACGEMVGGLFHYNYPGGTGLVSGAVFGRLAGRSAAADRG